MRFQSNRMDPQRYGVGQIKFLVVLIPLAILFGLPLLYIVTTAFKPIEELFAFPPRFFVKQPTLDNFRDMVDAMEESSIPFSRYLMNSILSTLAVVIATILITLSAGYTLAKKEFKGKELLNTINTMSMMFVPVAVTIPRYLVINALGVTNTIFALILPLIAMPVGLFLMVQSIKDIPDELINAARIDGANEWMVLTKVIVPLVKPTTATVAILSFQSAWNAIEPSSYFISDDTLRTFPYYVSALAAANNIAGAGMAAAATLVLLIPSLILFVIMQNKVMNTMAHSGIK